jgi:RimJ/RimL family protein N-acetyltransferase
MATILETPRLLLREMTPGDLDFLAVMLADPEVMRYYPKPLDREESEGWLRRQLDRYASHGYGFWLAQSRATGEPVGQVGLTPPRGIEGADETELGYLIHRPFWRQGLASEAAAACRDHAFDVLGRPRLICCIRPENLPSQGVARKIGLTPGAQRVELAGFQHVVFSQERGGRFGAP